MAKKIDSANNRLWLEEHFEDQSVQNNQKQQDVVFSLEELQMEHDFIKSGMRVIDLGAAPGGWSNYLAPIVGESGAVFSCDLVDMTAIDNVDFIQGDFREEAVLNMLLNKIEGNNVDIVLSDMTTSLEGNESTIEASTMYLAELALELCSQVLKPNGVFVVKVFIDESFDEFISELKHLFNLVKTSRLDRSKANANAVYLVAAGYKL